MTRQLNLSASPSWQWRWRLNPSAGCPIAKYDPRPVSVESAYPCAATPLGPQFQRREPGLGFAIKVDPPMASVTLAAAWGDFAILPAFAEGVRQLAPVGDVVLVLSVALGAGRVLPSFLRDLSQSPNLLDEARKWIGVMRFRFVWRGARPPGVDFQEYLSRFPWSGCYAVGSARDGHGPVPRRGRSRAVGSPDVHKVGHDRPSGERRRASLSARR